MASEASRPYEPHRLQLDVSEGEQVLAGKEGVKPIIILPPYTMSEEDIKTLRENDLCVVVAKEPSRVKFLDPILAMGGRTKVNDAAILRLARKEARAERAAKKAAKKEKKS